MAKKNLANFFSFNEKSPLNFVWLGFEKNLKYGAIQFSFRFI